MRVFQLGLLSALALASVPAQADHHQEASSQQAEHLDAGRWVTLGTRAGPVTSATRSQPANLLVAGDQNILVDVGDGTAGQLAHLGIQTAGIDAVFISHLHWDHTGGLAAILGLRAQTNAPPRLKIYGPPGTAELVSGLLASMVPGATAGYGVPGAPRADIQQMTEVVELRDNASVELAGMTVTVRNNTHYSFAADSDLARRFESLSFRFDLPGRSIVYTGDTGPSAAVEDLAKGADLLVAEMMDVDDTIAMVRRNNPNMPPQVAAGMERHLREHHLLPKDVGELAARAKVGAVVVTHFAGREVGDPAHLEYLREIATNYDGPVVIADDLDVF
ncbi:MBL fold metallo-hydrolase [Allopontixanthobacter sediminis]|uniref:MBL fold metallo-hydrolase n=1 Tax=Allopontixanthobacter sediminis TaxID=1689985 RepID=A0A845B4Y7_9SPHN|nr:MBL fold metallo-hydrolase [Allopontixanthobacter sediminis]MXP45755.1 MBL fold metallo-hydrolase [Allopontixanthobacter sediminis]